ncbi:MAG: redox-regulated ATPase YchF [Oscillospiraceae bacterium]|nr:redox-regulated ATPase YchF [Oscillospiraceae bacterium]
MKIGIVGLPNVGKSTLFNAITNAGAAAANFPFCTIEPNVGTVTVPDARLDWLAALYTPKKYTPATIEFVDIAGLVKGASKGEGLGNKFLSYIREVDAVIHVVRCFENDNVIHVDGSVDPLRDIGVIDVELILADIDIVERRIDKTAKAMKGDKSLAAELDFLKRLSAHLSDGKSAREMPVANDAERAVLADMPLLSAKPVIYAANLSDDDLFGGADGNPHYVKVRDLAARQGAGVIAVCAKAEEELASLSGEEKKEFLAELGVGESGLDKLIRESYRLLGLISFLTCGSDEVRAWTIKNGTRAPQAAGKIHTDFERGFIRAEVVAFEDLRACGTMAAAREKGLVRSEGKEYVMKDGDVTLFRFNV